MSQADNLAALATNVNSSGVLQPAGGGSGTTSSTGTGSLVLSNSPTLVTPTLGSASATQLATGLGSAAAPALTFTGDTNTGIFSPAADTIAFSEGGVESMRIDSSGNLGIGTATPAEKLQIVGTGDLKAEIQTNSTNNVAFRWKNASFSYIWQVISGAFRLYDETAGAERMRIDSSGNVGIGVTSTMQPLGVGNSSATTLGLLRTGVAALTGNTGPAINFYLSQTATTSLTGDTNLARIIANPNDGWGSNLQFFTKTSDGVPSNAPTERMRIDNAGRLNINCTGNPLPANGAARINMIVPSGDDGINIRHNHTGNCINIWRTASDGAAITFYQSAPPTQTGVGSINTTGSSTSYNTSSDYRLKENIAPMTGALATVQALKPVTYTWKVDGSASQGFIAHELQEVVPDAVSGEKDAVNEDGSIKPQGIDTSFLVATLTAAIQEQQQIINDLKARIETLETRE